jgi:tetratricopeptide (TPR) repeat protein/ABC-type dipeptide/oligopeptide/nickel transport system ATPase subunit
MTDFTPHNAPAKEVNQLPVMAGTRPVGRDALLKEIYEHLRTGGAVLLHGASGNGKSTLAGALAAAYTQQAGGVLWLDARLGDFASLLVQVGRAYGLDDVTTSENPTAHIGTISATLMQNKPFIVVDNIVNANTVAPFIDKVTGKLPTLLLSDESFDGSWTTVEMDKLEDIDAVTLFKQKAGINDNAQDIAIYGISKVLQYAPMPLVMAARGMVAAKLDVDTYASNIKQVAETIGGDTTLAAIATSYRALNNALQGLLLMLGASHTGEASAPLMAQVSGVPEANIDSAMTILTQLYLAEKFTRYGKPYYRLHPLVHRFALASLKNSNRLDALQEKMRDTLLAYAKQYGSGANLNHDMLANEMQNFIAIARHAATLGNRDIANQLLVTLTQADDFVSERGYVYELLLLRAFSSGSTAAFPAYGADEVAEYDDESDDDFDDYDELDGDDFDDDFDDGDFDDDDFDDDDFDDDDFDDDDFGDDFDDDFDDDDFEEESLSAGRSAASMGLGATPSVFGKQPTSTPDPLAGLPSDTASLQKIDIMTLRTALAQAKEAGDTMRVMQTLKALGKVQIAQGSEQEAIGTYNELLQIQDEQGDDTATLETLDMLATLLNKTGNTNAAIMHATRGVQMAREAGAQDTLMQLQMQLGDARQELGESDNAIHAYTEALSIARQNDDSQHEALILYRLGYAHLDHGEPDTAIHTWTQARDLFKAQGKRGYEGRVMGGLGSAHADMERWNDAIRYYTTALYIAREVGDSEEEAIQLSNLGQAQKEANLLPDALLSYRQALHLAYVSEQKDNIASAVVDLVELMLRSNRLLDICNLLLDDAITHDPNDRDLLNLKQTVMAQRTAAIANGARLAPVSGTARDYAANAYQLLDG